MLSNRIKQQVEPFSAVSLAINRINFRCFSHSLGKLYNGSPLNSGMLDVVDVKLYLTLNIYQESLKVSDFKIPCTIYFVSSAVKISGRFLEKKISLKEFSKRDHIVKIQARIFELKTLIG
jgi:hypothetical protein